MLKLCQVELNAARGIRSIDIQKMRRLNVVRNVEENVLRATRFYVTLNRNSDNVVVYCSLFTANVAHVRKASGNPINFIDEDTDLSNRRCTITLRRNVIIMYNRDSRTQIYL